MICLVMISDVVCEVGMGKISVLCYLNGEMYVLFVDLC